MESSKNFSGVTSTLPPRSITLRSGRLWPRNGANAGLTFPTTLYALAWLSEYRTRGGKTEGLIIPFSASTLRRKRRRNAQVAGLEAWPQQGARHTYCSAWLRQHGDINKLVIQAGHESPMVLWNHYYQAMSPEAAGAFWNIFPPAREPRQIFPLKAASFYARTVTTAQYCP